MDITNKTKELIAKMQSLKLKYTDLASQTFIDFYCQCRQGCDYLFPNSVKSSVTILHILEWFLLSVEKRSPYLLIEIMWKDILGPTLGEYQEDEKIEANLLNLLSKPELAQSIQEWDRKPRPDGGVTLTLRELLQDMADLEQQSE